MKNKKLFFKIYLIFIIIAFISIITLVLLGKKERVGYLSEFKINVDKTLELNGFNVEDTKELFIINNKLVEENITNYILTNEVITNYSYDFRIKYYSKVFRNNDIYNVYTDINKFLEENSSIKEMKMNDNNGTPFGNLVSDKQFKYDEKIENINYSLKVKIDFLYTIILIIIICIAVGLLYFKSNTISSVLIVVFCILSIFLLNIPTLKTRKAEIKYITLKDTIIINDNTKEVVQYNDEKLIDYNTNDNLITNYNYSATVEYNENIPIKIFKVSYNLEDFYEDYPYIKDLNVNYQNDKWISFTSDSPINNQKNYFIYYDLIINIIVYIILLAYIFIINLISRSKYVVFISLILIVFLLITASLKTKTAEIKYMNLNYIALVDNDTKEIVQFNNKKIIDYNLNNIVTNYNYSFTIEYENNFLINKIFFVNYNLKKFLSDYPGIKIFIDGMNDKWGILQSNYKIDYNKKYLINYNLAINNFIIYLILFILICILLKHLDIKSIKKYFIKYNIINHKICNEKIIYSFIIFIFSICLFIFQFWLTYPGFFQFGDTLDSMGEGFDKNYNNWHPVIIAVVLNFLYRIFGYHTSYILFINLFLWYISIFLIILSLYLKYNKKRVILLYLISFLANIFFMNIIHIKDSTATLFVFFSYSILFFVINTVKLKWAKILLCLFSILALLIGMLWRHNFIVTIYPMFIMYTYLFLEKETKNKKIYFVKFFSIMLIIAIFLVCIVKIFPTLFVKDMTYSKLATNHLFLLQIAGCTVPSNDKDMIPNEWYLEGKNFNDLKKLYQTSSLYADPFGRPGSTILFKAEKLDKLKIVWLKSIIKHPINYLMHIIRYSSHIIVKNTWKISPYSIQLKDVELYPFVLYYINNFDNRGVTLNPIKYKIYSFIYYTALDINTLFFIVLATCLFVFSIIFLIFQYRFINNGIVFLFSTSFSAFSTIVIVCLFSPDLFYRYIYPVVPISIMALIGFITFIYDRGGIKKFIQELRGKDK